MSDGLILPTVAISHIILLQKASFATTAKESMYGPENSLSFLWRGDKERRRSSLEWGAKYECVGDAARLAHSRQPSAATLDPDFSTIWERSTQYSQYYVLVGLSIIDMELATPF